MPGLSFTFAVILMTLLAWWRASAHRGPVGGSFSTLNRRLSEREDVIASSSVHAMRRSTTPSFFGEATDVCARRIPWLLSYATNSALRNSLSLPELTRSTTDEQQSARMSARHLANTNAV